MIINVELDLSGIQQKLAQMERDLPRQLDKALLQTAVKGVGIIKKRTNAGRGINKYFKRYTPKYAAFRRKKGRQVSPVNLQFTGRMLGAMQAFGHRGYAEISFTRAEESKKAYFNNQKRPFFGFNKTEKRQLLEFMKKRLFK